MPVLRGARLYGVDKVLGAFRLDTGCEPASCAGGRENSLALQAPGATRLCLTYKLKCGMCAKVWCATVEVSEKPSVNADRG